MLEAVLSALLALGSVAPSATVPVEGPVVLTLKDHRFTPSEISAPAGRRIEVVLVNQDAATEEFDSDDLQVEKFVSPRGRIAFTLGPLKPGRYTFMGEYHSETANGVLTVVDASAAAR